MKNLLLFVALGLICGCTSLVKDEELVAVKRKLSRPVKVYMTGLPGEMNFTRLENDEEAAGGYSVSGSVSVGYSSKPGYGHGHFYDDLYDSFDEDGERVTSFGSKKSMGNAIQKEFFRWTGSYPKILEKFDKLPQGNEIYINLETKKSQMRTRMPFVKAGFRIGGFESHTGGSLGVDVQKNEFCRADVDFVVNVVTKDGQIREEFSVSSDRISYREQKDLKKALRQAYELVAREVVYYVLNELPQKR